MLLCICVRPDDSRYRNNANVEGLGGGAEERTGSQRKNIIRVSVVGHVARVRENRSFYRIPLDIVEERNHLEDLGLDGGNIEEFIKKLRWEAFVQCRDKSQAVSNTMTCLSFPSSVSNFLSNVVSVSF